MKASIENFSNLNDALGRLFVDFSYNRLRTYIVVGIASYSARTVFVRKVSHNNKIQKTIKSIEIDSRDVSPLFPNDARIDGIINCLDRITAVDYDRRSFSCI